MKQWLRKWLLPQSPDEEPSFTALILAPSKGDTVMFNGERWGIVRQNNWCFYLEDRDRVRHG